MGYTPGAGLSLIDLHDREAVACGFIYVSLAIVLHAVFFWRNRPGLARVAYFMTLFGLTALGAAVIHLLYLYLYTK